MKTPLAHKVRPSKLEDIKGQDHLIPILKSMIENKSLFSCIFYGPPGTGKTSIAMVLANELGLPYRKFNAVTGNKKDLDSIFLEAKLTNNLIVIIDEVHRLNKDKQDLLLPYIEDGSLIMLAATTSNPLFSIRPAIRSRCHLFEVKPLNNTHIKEIINNVKEKENININDEAINSIALKSNGDVRFALNLLDLLSILNIEITSELVEQYSYTNAVFDKDEDGHYDSVSAFQKSIRGSDVNAALYYLARLGLANDMDSIERRLLVIAYEDIGLANPAACARVVNAIDAAKRVGFPEAFIPLSVAIIDLCLSPKSRSATDAIHKATDIASKNSFMIPSYLRLNYLGIDEDNKYDYSLNKIWPYIQYLPNEIKNEVFYLANKNSSYEKQLSNNYDELNKIKRTDNIKALKDKFKK